MTLEEAKKIRSCNGRGYSTVEFIQALQLTEEIKNNNTMTQENKQLLLKDLCGRLPYGVVLDTGTQLRSIDNLTQIISGFGTDKKIENTKYYLRPMSSMTDNEWIKFYKWANCRIEKDSGEIGSKSRGFGEGYEYLGIDDMSDAIDWLNAYHFDYRGLIEKGLALEAPKGMYD